MEGFNTCWEMTQTVTCHAPSCPSLWSRALWSRYCLVCSSVLCTQDTALSLLVWRESHTPHENSLSLSLFLFLQWTAHDVTSTDNLRTLWCGNGVIPKFRMVSQGANKDNALWVYNRVQIYLSEHRRPEHITAFQIGLTWSGSRINIF